MMRDYEETATAVRMATFRLARRLRRERAVEQYSDAHMAVLSSLRIHGPLTISTLAEREHVTAPSMTNMINTLTDAGLVVRVPGEADRRQVFVEITDAGADIVVETLKMRDEVLASVLKDLDFTTDELRTLREASALMRKVSDR